MHFSICVSCAMLSDPMALQCVFLSTGPVEDYSLDCQQAIHVGTLAACLECRCKACGRSWSTGPQHIISLNSTLASCCPWDTVYAVCSFTYSLLHESAFLTKCRAGIRTYLAEQASFCGPYQVCHAMHQLSCC